MLEPSQQEIIEFLNTFEFLSGGIDLDLCHESTQKVIGWLESKIGGVEWRGFDDEILT